MIFKLYRIETYGMKNITNKITLDFYPLTIESISKKNISNVKAIYGSNGVGKSAIMNSVFLFKQLSSNPNFLKQSVEISKLNKIINKEIKEFYFSIVYSVLDDELETKKIYKSELLIKFAEAFPYITSEKYYILKDQTINGKYSMIFEVENGKLSIYDKSDTQVNEFINNRTLNMLKYSSCTSILNDYEFLTDFLNFIKEKNLGKETGGITEYLLINSFFVDNITVFMEEPDFHNELNERDIALLLEKLQKINPKNNGEKLVNNTISSEKDAIPKIQFESYKNNIEGLTEFLKLFKPNLKRIRLETSEDENFFYCSKKMVYNNYEVDSDYESTGIQKLMRIYNSINDVAKGKIVFIDELDANVNGVYLMKLIEYINTLKNGELCFTSHNFYPMEYLYKFSNSIDFLGETGKLIAWKKNGNYKPYNQYPEGMIIDSPFNIDVIDFAKVFNRKDEN